MNPYRLAYLAVTALVVAALPAVGSDAVRLGGDSDLDGIADGADNCTVVANPDQRDTDGDGFGNACDADLNNDCSVNFGDLADLKAAFFPDYDEDADFDNDGSVNFGDLALMKSSFFNGANPGPGPGLGCVDCSPPDALGGNLEFAGLQMFMRGAFFNDWAANQTVNVFSDQSDGVYVARFELVAGTYEYKVADEGWSIDYCTTTQLQVGAATNLPLFGCAFPSNGVISVPQTGCYEFELQTDGNVPPTSVDVTFTPVN